jgi:hypothetical protein
MAAPAAAPSMTAPPPTPTSSGAVLHQNSAQIALWHRGLERVPFCTALDVYGLTFIATLGGVDLLGSLKTNEPHLDMVGVFGTNPNASTKFRNENKRFAEMHGAF